MLRILTRCLQVVLAIIVAIAGLGWFRFGQRAGRRFEVTVEPIAAATSRADIVRGEHLARSIGGCAHCHGDDFGGRVAKEDAMMRLASPNITSGEGGVVAGYADADWVRAILHGVARDGRPLLIMPATSLRGFSDDDVAAIIGYLKQVPPVDRRVPSAEVKLPGQVVAGLASLPLFPAEAIDHRAGRDVAPPRGPTRAYGIYLANFCSGCHGKDFRGGIRHDPDEPASADISPGAMAGWTYEAFQRALREGKRRDGSDLSPAMPWQATRALSDDEIQALWLALRGTYGY
jgi:cytochrome c553